MISAIPAYGDTHQMNMVNALYALKTVGIAILMELVFIVLKAMEWMLMGNAKLVMIFVLLVILKVFAYNALIIMGSIMMVGVIIVMSFVRIVIQKGIA
jgi:hypothetical protein